MSISQIEHRQVEKVKINGIKRRTPFKTIAKHRRIA
jgi:hypothetical protein